MKKRLVGLTAVGTAVLVVIGLSVTGLPGASAEDNETLHFVEQGSNVTYVPAQNAIKPSATAPPGDYVVFEDPLWANGVQVGTNDGECFITNPNATHGVLECPGVTFTFNGKGGFPKGSIQGAGIFLAPTTGAGPENPDPFLYGTGAFAGAQGILSGHQNASGNDDWTLSFNR